MPFKWYPGARVLSQAFLWRLADLEESDGPPIDLVIATKFPSYCVRHPHKVVWLLHQFRQAYELDRHRARRSSASRRRTARRAAPCSGSTASRSARRASSSPPRSNVADRLRRSTGLDAEVMPHPPQELPYRTAPARGLRPLRGPARPREADRPAARGRRAGARRCACVVAGDGPDRERLEGLARSRPQRPRPLRRPRRRRGARRPLRALPRRLLRAGRRGLRDGAVRGVPLREARADDDRRGRAARGRRSTARPGSSCAPRRRRRSRRACAWLRGHADEAAALGPRGQGGRRAASRGTRRSSGCSREGRLLLADAAGALRDRRLQRAAAAGAARAGRACSSRSAAGGDRRAAPTSRSTTSATTPTRTAGSSTRCAAGPASSSSTTSSSTTSSPA